MEAWALAAIWVSTGPLFVILAASPITTPVTISILERFYILSSIAVAVFAGIGVFGVLELLRRRNLPGRAVAIGGAAALAALVLTLGAVRWSDVDQSENRLAETYSRDLLDSLEPGSILLTRGDHNYTGLVYAQFVDGYRTDVTLVDLGLLVLDSYKAELLGRDPNLVMPFDSYRRTPEDFAALVAANEGQRPVYGVGVFDENVDEVVNEQRAGLVRRLTTNFELDEYALLVADRTRASDLNFPSGPYPEESWEAIITGVYASAAHSAGFAFHETEPTPNDAFVEEMYNLSITLEGPEQAYKNLGLFYLERDADPATVIDLWETYLSLDPDDPQVGAIRDAIEQLRGE